MLKSTHRSATAAAPLPPGWTEHKAPTGHAYYYNATTQQSTYVRPHAEVVNSEPLTEKPAPGHGLPNAQVGLPFQGGRPHNGPGTSFASHPGRGSFQQQWRRSPEDRPKRKQAIPGCAPWLLVHTKLGRRFVYNPELGESFWKFPPDVMACVIELDRKEREKKERRARGEVSDVGMELDTVKPEPMPVAETAPQVEKKTILHDSDYEEVEVTDDEDETNPSKRPRTEDSKPDGPVEFNEDDIAYQLAAMGQGEDEFDEQDWDKEEPLLEADANALFHDLLDDYKINPYSPWESLIEAGKIIEDERYTCLPNMKSRKESFAAWSRDRIQKIKDQREQQEKKDPRIPYTAFLQKNATPKLYWPEFKRKFKKEPEMRDNKIQDKDREKWYREYINRLKLPESTLKTDLISLLDSLPLSALNRSTSLSALPPALLTDMRYISLRAKIRDPLIEYHITKLPMPEASDLSPEEEAANLKQKQERERREKALAERERRVQEQKRIQSGKLAHSKGMLREEEDEVRRAMRVGREGLLGHFES